MIRYGIYFLLFFSIIFNYTNGYAADNSDSGSSLYESFKDKSSSYFNIAKDKLSDLSNTAKEKSADLLNSAKELISSKPSQNPGEVEDTDNPYFQKMWQKFTSISNDAIELATGKNPHEKTVFEFVTLQEPKYVRLLKDAQEILSHSEATEQFDAIEKLRAQNRELKSEISELRLKRVSAPESSMNPLATTKKSIDKKLASIPGEISENEREITQLKTEIIAILNKHGINMSMEELDYFLVSAEGSDLMRLISVAENMKRIQKVIENELQTDKNNVELARIYTGMYLVSLDAYATAHDTVLKNIEGYLDKLSDIIAKAHIEYDEAKNLSNDVDAQDKTKIESNIRINKRMIEVGNMYDDLLHRRSDNLKQSKANLEKKVKVARNTYRTISNGTSLINLVNDGSNEYAILVNFEMPELKSMYDDAIMSAFTDISEQIKLEK